MKEEQTSLSVETNDWSRVLVKDLLLHTDDLFHERVNIFLVAEAIFFAAISSVWDSQSVSLKLVVCILGLILTPALWWPLSRLEKALIFYVQKFATTKGNEVYADITKLGISSLPSSSIFTIFIPVIVWLSWLVLFITVIKNLP